MSLTPLESISIRDFRSIRGEVSLPLDAPIVLLHGPNGAGKTSLLAALELAIAGSIPSMHRSDDQYWKHLVHKDADEANVTLRSSEGPDHSISFESGKKPKTTRLPFGDELASFFSERCYLPQSRLGRLLDVYQQTEADTDSALTRYVKDLLGLDQFDALIDGLHPVGDVRNLRKAVPEYGRSERDLERAKNSIARLGRELTGLGATRTELVQAAQEACRRAGIEDDEVLLAEADPDDVLDWLNGFDYEGELQRVLEWRVEADALLAQLAEVPRADSDRFDVERQELDAADDAVREWSRSFGDQIEFTLEKARSRYQSVPDSRADPARSVRIALDAADSDLGRLDSGIERLDVLQQEEAELERQLGLAAERSTLAAIRLAELAPDAASLGRALAAIVPHVHSDECPVCGRDFSEVDQGPLSDALSARIADLTENAERIEELSAAHAAATASAHSFEARLADVRAEVRGLGDRSELQRERADVASIEAALRRLSDAAATGSTLIDAAARMSQRIGLLEAGDRRMVEVANATATLRSRAAIPEVSGDTTPEGLSALRSTLAERHRLLSQKRNDTEAATASVSEVIVANERIASVTDQLRDAVEVERRLASALRGADSVRAAAKRLRAMASDERSRTIRRVFNESLNGVWRDLFVRLAPNEPFVPTFRIPTEGTRAVDAVLETVYRSSGRGGSPSIMLSAGNLNTAALTLFLGLHLSIEPRLPILVLDDPVQSMDEVHIAQLAALLRTIAREHGRQIILAVHERPLFEYLSLELYPAFEGDALVTAELTRSTSSTSAIRSQRHTFRADEAIA